jgi:hypothetical protein
MDSPEAIQVKQKKCDNQTENMGAKNHYVQVFIYQPVVVKVLIYLLI